MKRLTLLFAVVVLLAAAVAPVCADQVLMTNRSDYLTVPNGKILGDKTLDVSVGSIGPDFVSGAGNTAIFATGVGIGPFEATINGSLDDFDVDDMYASLKWQIDDGVEGLAGFGKVKAAVFLDNLGKHSTGIPGFAMTGNISKYLELTAAGWYNDGVSAGGALQWHPASWFAPTVEYSTDTHWAYGADFSYKDLYARVVYSDDSDDWYANVGHVFTW